MRYAWKRGVTEAMNLVGELYDSNDPFAVAVAAHHRRLAGFAFLLCGDRVAADDLVAEAYARVWARYQHRSVDDLGPYLHRVVANLAAGRMRRLRVERRQTEQRTIDWRQSGADLAHVESTIDDRDQLWPAIWKLPADQRVVIVLRLVEDQSEQATARLLGVRPGTVKSRLARGIATLRLALEQDNA